MNLNLPTAAELRGEQTSVIQMASKDSSWVVKLKDNDDLEPADVHGA
ncbi:hypothetical protein GCM10010149_70460 [Nonomuraea roseoviolacea subsp. roseoviolacea]|uniref:Uncharacterized protein n=1 Tax=Nonomuraea roseoviolacea subsp. carminata TaxID=160689 RepID=A0ABT1K9T3_9ACTN|nr:hypothetical protein [Nonomuraea roseoviolacea]MCP2350151.1 hypothetical protein [Nonomuraea roseoviolacea subsp. carminata]